MTNADDNFLDRWSRRKTEARQGLRRKAEPVATLEPEPVDMPEAISHWIEGFVETHHTEQKFKKRRRDEVSQQEHKFGSIPTPLL